MDKDGNLTQEEIKQLAKLLIDAKTWWNNPNASIYETTTLINQFEEFRKELEK